MPVKKYRSVMEIKTAEDLARALAIRRQVFVKEQGIAAELDEDGLDEEALHLLAVSGGRAVGTVRLVTRPEGSGELARVAVLPEARGSGIGRALVRKIEAAAREMGLSRLVLHPHAHLERFYRDLGYRTVPGTPQAASHSLITMEKELGIEGSARQRPQPGSTSTVRS